MLAVGCQERTYQRHLTDIECAWRGTGERAQSDPEGRDRVIKVTSKDRPSAAQGWGEDHDPGVQGHLTHSVISPLASDWWYLSERTALQPGEEEGVQGNLHGVLCGTTL